MSNWYLNRFKNPPTSIRRKLNQPPYHVHQEYEDKIEELTKKEEDLGVELKSFKGYYSARVNILHKDMKERKKLDGEHKGKIDGLLKRADELSAANEKLEEFKASADKRIKAADSGVKSSKTDLANATKKLDAAIKRLESAEKRLNDLEKPATKKLAEAV